MGEALIIGCIFCRYIKFSQYFITALFQGPESGLNFENLF